MLRKLYPFQEIGARHLASNFHAMLSDQPGLGKSFSAIAATEIVNAKNILVVCPASVRLGWYDEIEKTLGHTRGWDIISYNAAQKFSQNPLRSEYDVFISDECHFLRGADTQRSIAVLGTNGIARLARYKWGLSGTPMLNRPQELYNILATLAPDRIAPYNSFGKFAQKFCNAYYDGYAINTRGASNIEELRERLKGFMLRRTKLEVLPELPPRIIQRVPLDVSSSEMKAIRNEEELISNREARLSSVHEDFSQMGDLAKLLRITGLAKVRAACQFIEESLDTVEGKIVVFTRHRDVVVELQRELSSKGIGAVAYQGGMTDNEKKEAIDTFVENPNIQVFIGNIQAAGTGINGLQKVSNTVIFAELSWTPGEMSQAIDRVDRMDKRYGGPTVAYVLHIPGSLESAMLGVLDSKTKIIDKLFGSNSNDGQEDLLAGLM